MRMSENGLRPKTLEIAGLVIVVTLMILNLPANTTNSLMVVDLAKSWSNNGKRKMVAARDRQSMHKVEPQSTYLDATLTNITKLASKSQW